MLPTIEAYRADVDARLAEAVKLREDLVTSLRDTLTSLERYYFTLAADLHPHTPLIHPKSVIGRARTVLERVEAHDRRSVEREPT